MISGVRPERAAGVLVSTLLALLLTGSPARPALAATADLAELMGELSKMQDAAARFTERKHLSILDQPLVLEGTVRYRAPDYVRKEYDDPDAESYEVEGDRLTIELADGRRRDLSIDEHPMLRAFVESYRGTLSGDLETLSRYFHLELEGPMDAWLLRLTPRDPELGRYLGAVVMEGRGGRVLRIETLEASGDRSIMTLDVPAE